MMKNQAASVVMSQYRAPTTICRAVASILCLLISVGPVNRANADAPLLRARVSSTPTRQDAADTHALERGTPVTRDVQGGEAHTYRIMLAADQYVHAVIEQMGVNVLVAATGPDGKELSAADGAKGTQGTEHLTFISEVSGDHRIEVRPAERGAAGGRYEARIIALRAPTEDERALEEARQLSEESSGRRRKV